ncbi:MAG: hypothetical protein CMF59_19940 [Leptospiraceae bacterium]|nr:hypothetical protein [Leptospiraceae bacterium]
MLDILVWIILFSIFAGIVLVVHYWYELFRRKDRYGREEILNIPQIIQDQLMYLTDGRDRLLQFGGIGVGIAIGWGLTWVGGFFSPDVGPEPDWASAQMPNYFFQSALFVLILHLAYPSFRDLAHDSGGSSGVLMRLLNTEIGVFFGLTTTLASINLTSWGVHHQSSFLFSLINAVICLLYAGYRLDQKQEALENEGIESSYDDYDDYESDEMPGGSDFESDFASDDQDSDSIVPRYQDDLPDDFQEPEDLQSRKGKGKSGKTNPSAEDRIADLELPDDNTDF